MKPDSKIIELEKEIATKKCRRESAPGGDQDCTRPVKKKKRGGGGEIPPDRVAELMDQVASFCGIQGEKGNSAVVTPEHIAFCQALDLVPVSGSDEIPDLPEVRLLVKMDIAASCFDCEVSKPGVELGASEHFCGEADDEKSDRRAKVQAFVEEWRRLFLTATRPLFLPKGWCEARPVWT